MSELNLQVGEWYERRDGAVIGPIAHFYHPYFCFRIDMTSYNSHGKFFGDDVFADGDLIAHVPRTDPRHPEYKAPPKPDPATARVTIDIPVPPEGWQVDGYRVPVVGEMRFMHGEWRHVKDSCNFRWPVAVRLVPPWTPPAWLAPGWVTVDDDGKPYWSESKEKPVWWSSIGTWGRNPGYMHSINPKMFRDFTPPPICGEHAIWEIT
jgi:hypothetical protein